MTDKPQWWYAGAAGK